MNTDALLVFAKVPVPGHVKTRLTALLSEEEAARLYAAFLQDALTQYQSLGVDVRLYLGPSSEKLDPALADLATSVHNQHGDGLGARMQHAFLESFMAGYERLVIIGTDHPTLPSVFITQAFDALVDPLSVSLGPSEDGGYYLLGMNDLFPELFRAMTYSHPDVFRQTLDRAMASQAGITVLPEWYDVDTPETLLRLVRDLEPQGQARQTRDVVASLVVDYPSLQTAINVAALVPQHKHETLQAHALVAMGYPAVEPVLSALLEWMQDINWPVAQVLHPFLAGIGAPLAPYLRPILESDDGMWKYWILSYILAPSPELKRIFSTALHQLATAPTPQEKADELDLVAIEILNGSEGP